MELLNQDKIVNIRLYQLLVTGVIMSEVLAKQNATENWKVKKKKDLGF